MNEEIEAIKGALDLLIARSLAQEAMLLWLVRHQDRESEPFRFADLDLRRTLAYLRQEASHSDLSDAQLALLDAELNRVRHRLATLPPADELPY